MDRMQLDAEGLGSIEVFHDVKKDHHASHVLARLSMPLVLAAMRSGKWQW